MEAYETLGILGEGTYGVVTKARHRATGKLVAIKRFKQTDADDHVRKTSTREVRMLQQLKHPNVVRLEDVFRREGKLYIVLEYIDNTILQVLESTTRGIPPRDLRRYTYQLLRGLEFCHAHNIIHRDIKPENVLIDQSGMLKLCDFGFARQITGKGKYTDYVATRWYRAPELLVGDVSYGKPVDVWALGCVFAELSDGQPLFPGESDLDQLCLITQTCGPVPDRMVSIFEHNPLYRNVSYPHTGIVYTLQERYHRQSEDWLEFLYSCLHPDPAKRLTCTELMSLPYFTQDGFRERYEQELRAMSGLPLLRANPTASAPSPTRRTVGDTVSGSKNTLDAAALGANATTPATTIATAPPTVDPALPISNKKHQLLGQKGDASKYKNSVEAGKSKVSENDNSFLPSVLLPTSVLSEGSVQLPMISNQSTEKTMAGAVGAAAALAIAMQEEVAKTPSMLRRYGAQAPAEAVVSPSSNSCTLVTSMSLRSSRQPRTEAFSHSLSTGLSSRRTSVSSLAVSPVKNTDSTAIGTTYPESSRCLSNVTDNADGSVDSRRPPGAVVPNARNKKEAAAASVAAAGVSGTRGGESRCTSRSSFSNTSRRSSSLRSERSETKLGLSPVHTSSSAISFPSNITDAVLKAAAGQQQQQPYLTPLTHRLPDLTSPKLHLSTHDKRGSVDTEDIPKPPSQPLHPPSPTSFNGSAASQASLNPLAVPLSRERVGNVNGNGIHGVAKARRSGPYDAGDTPHTYAKKKLAKRKKGSLARRGSRSSSSRSTSHCSQQGQFLEALRARGVHGYAGHQDGKQGSASVSALKLLTLRTSLQHLPDTSLRSQDLHTEEALSRLLDEERANRMHGMTASQQDTLSMTANNKRSVEQRGSMPHKERRSKPLHAPPNPSPHQRDSHARSQLQQQPQSLDTVLQPVGTDVAQRVSATLRALSALRDSTVSNKSPCDTNGVGDAVGSLPDKYSSFNRHRLGADNTVSLPLKKKTSESSGVSQTEKSTSSRSRKPLSVSTSHSARLSLDEGDSTILNSNKTNTNTLHVHAANTLESLPSSQYGGFSVHYRRTSNTGSNGGVQPPLPQQSSTKKSSKNCSPISQDVSNVCGGSGVIPHPGGHQVGHPPSFPPSTTAATTEKSTPRRRENSRSNKKMLPLTYNAATATATHM